MKKDEVKDLRYPIGKFEHGKKYSLDDTRKHIRVLSRFPKDLKKVLEKLRREDIDTSYRKGGWTVRQVVHHIADSHMNAYIRTKLAVTEQTPIIKPYEEQFWAETEDGKRGSVKMSLKLISALHRRWIEFLESLSEDDLERGYFHPASGRVVPVQEAIALYVWHSQHHLAHIKLVADGEAQQEEKEVKAKTGKKEVTAPAKRGPKPKSAPEDTTAGATEAKPRRIRRTQEQMAADKAAAVTKPPIDRAAILAKARAARKSNAAQPESSTASAKSNSVATSRPKQAEAKEVASPVANKRTRRTKEQMAADKAAAVVKPPIDRAAIMEKARAARMANLAAAAPSTASATDAKTKSSSSIKVSSAQPEQPAKQPVDRAAILEKARAARMANLAAAKPVVEAKATKQSKTAASADQPAKAPKPAATAKTKAPKAASGESKPRGMSAEHMAKIRDARMAKRAADIAAGIIPAPKTKPVADPNAPKLSRVEILAKARAARMANLASKPAAEATPAKQPKTKTAATADQPARRTRRSSDEVAAAKAAKAEKSAAGGSKPKGMSAEHMAKIRDARMAKRAADIAAGIIPAPKPKPVADPNAPKLSRGEILAKARAARTSNKKG